MKLVVGVNAQEREALRFRARNDSFVTSLMEMRRLTYLAGGLPGLLLSLGSAAVFLFGGWRVIDGAITMGTLVAFVAYQVRLLAPIQGLMGLYAGIATARVSLRRVHEILDAPHRRRRVARRASPMPKARGALALRQRDALLRSRRVGARPGERCAVAAGERDGHRRRQRQRQDYHRRPASRGTSIPTTARCSLDGADLQGRALADVRRHVVVVDQEPFVFNATHRGEHPLRAA